MFRKLAGYALAASISFGGVALANTSHADASGTTLQTVSQTETLVSQKCYKTHRVTTTYYHWSKTRYILYPSPKRTVTDSETCHS